MKGRWIMNFWDRQIGAMDGAAATARNYERAIDQWENHSNQLEAKLRAATQNAEELAKQRLYAQAQLEGQKALVQELQRELGRVGSNSALAQEENAKKIRLSAMATFLKKHGYDYDTKTEMVRKI
jgi:predicted  nucleic acid-binding Zn-ribbon protein